MVVEVVTITPSHVGLVISMVAVFAVVIQAMT